MHSAPEMMMFLNRAAGYMVIAMLLRAAMATPDGSHASVPYADLAEWCGVSRTHVRKLLALAEEMKLLKLDGRGGRQVRILPRMWACHDHGIAGGMYLHDLVYLAATRELVREAAE
jgi:hypothetical protein